MLPPMFSMMFSMMFTMMYSTMFSLLLALPQQAAPVVQQPAPPAASRPAPARRPAQATGTGAIEVRVTDRSGTPVAGAEVSAEGLSSRDGVTDANGRVVLRTMRPGTYRIRAEHDGLVTLEKELSIRTGAPASVDFALTAAPAPPEPVREAAAAPPPASAAPPPLTAGEPKVLSISDLAERSLSGRDAVKTVPIGCSGASRSQLLVIRDAYRAVSREEIDAMFYLVAGEAVLTLNDKEQALEASAFALVPRGTPFKIARKGRNPAIFLAILGGPSCSTSDRPN